VYYRNRLTFAENAVKCKMATFYGPVLLCIYSTSSVGVYVEDKTRKFSGSWLQCGSCWWYGYCCRTSAPCKFKYCNFDKVQCTTMCTKNSQTNG